MPTIADLFEPDKYHQPKAIKSRPTAQRTQNRRQRWEDATSPALYENTLFGTGDKYRKDFGGPTKFLPGTEDKIAVMEARHAARLPIHHKEDHGSKPVDWTEYAGFVQAVGDITKANASGVELVADLGTRAKPWRAHPWDADAGSNGQGAHVHLGYYDRWEGACFAVRLWNAACGQTDTDSIDCSKWAPQGSWTDEDVARLTEDDIKRIAASRRYGQ
jgi:hypothetical protein